MHVPMLDMAAHQAPFADALKAALADVVDSGRYILGPRVEALEAALAADLGAADAVAVSSGTDALLLAWMVLGLGPGDAVLTTPMSFAATAESLVRLGIRPVFADVDPETGLLDPAAARTAIDRDPAIKGLLPVHLFGQCADLAELSALAGERGLLVVEDAAQAIGSRLQGPGGEGFAGTFGAFGCFSFYPSKNLGGIGDGGLVVASTAELASRARALRNHGATERGHEHVGGNFRMDALQAAALLVKRPFLDRWIAARQAHAAYYDEVFADLPWLRPLGRHGATTRHTFNQYVVRVRGRGRRDALREHLLARGISSAIYYPTPLHLQPAFRTYGPGPGELPHSERLAAEVLALPVYPELDEDRRKAVVDAVRCFEP